MAPVRGLFYQSKRFKPEIAFVINDFGGAETVQSGELKEWFKSKEWLGTDLQGPTSRAINFGAQRRETL